MDGSYDEVGFGIKAEGFGDSGGIDLEVDDIGEMERIDA